MEAHAQEDIRSSFYDGMFSNMFATLTGGVFLTGFALYLGMNEFVIGLVASMPFLVTVFQLPASYLVEKTGKRKNISFWSAAIARTIWIPMLIVPLLSSLSVSIKLLVILSMIFLSYTFASISYVSWLSWMSDLVPDEIRGRFFGTRNMLCGATGMIVLVVFGRLLDTLNGHECGRLPVGFGVTFLSAVFFGMVSLHFLNRISEPHQTNQAANRTSFQVLISLPFKEANFRKFLFFALLWSFSVYFASPFFTLYFLRDLRFSYSFVATLGMMSAFADLIGMRLWGRISDRVNNKAVIRFAGWVAVFLPLAWVSARPQSTVIPIILNVVGGGFWAGINLCMNNLLLRISPQENRTPFFSVYNIMGGLGGAIGPILAGFVLKSLSELDLSLFSWKLLPLQVIFIASTLFRLLSFQFLKYVHEPEEVTVRQIVQILRSVRGLNIATGFSYLLHPFIEVTGEKREGKT
jgi:MFS family permease